MARILCVEDSKEFQIYLNTVLHEHFMTFVSTVADAVRAVEGGRDNFDLILLDISLPDGNGMKILPKLKEILAHRLIPVIVLSAEDDTLSKVAAFGVGADDYISKPPDVSELRARIEARLRIAKAYSGEKTILEFGDLVVDTERMVAEVGAAAGRQAVDLTPFEFKILRLLMNRPGQVYSREQIIERIWGVGHHVTARTVDAHISHLRQKLTECQAQIETVLTVGYKISLKDTVSS